MKPTLTPRQQRTQRGYALATLTTITRDGAFYRVPSSRGRGSYLVAADSRELQQLAFRLARHV
jgi:hypothetical protein